MLTRAPFPGYGTDYNKLVQRMTAQGVEDLEQLLLGKIGTFGSFIYGIEPLPYQLLQLEYLECEESAHKQSATGSDSMALDPEGRISERY
jgi:hypothetical protein